MLWGTMAGIRVVVAEPDDQQRRAIASELQREGFDVLEFVSEEELPAIVASGASLAIVAISPGECDGLAIARTLRASGDTKVIFISSLADVNDRLAGFDLGAEDYLVKPLSLPELMARVRVIMRRSAVATHEQIVVGDVVIDLDAAVVRRGRHTVELTGTEFKLLTYLARNAGRAVPKAQLLSYVWASEVYDPNLVEVHMSALRRKIDAHGPRFIRTVRGIGYRLDTPVAMPEDEVLTSTRELVGVGAVRQAEYAELALGTHRLSGLIDDLLARDNASALLPPNDYATVDLAKVVDELLLTIPPTRSVTVNRLGLAIAPVLGDQARLGVLFGHLIDNAMQHSSPGGSVKVTIEVAIHDIVARVQDDGPGVPAADRERIFDRFVRLDTSAISLNDGLGLGLAISRAIANEHGGTLTCDDPESGQGALFTLRLPAAQISMPV